MAEDKRLNEIIRIQKKRTNFVMLDKGFIDDPRLSIKAKGILTYLLSKPDEWKVIIRDIVNHCKDGKDSIYAGLNELKKYGYYEKNPIRGSNGKIVCWESVVYETPIEKKTIKTIENSEVYPLTENPDMANPYLDKPYLENPERSKNYISNIELSNIESHLISNQSVLTAEKEKTDMIRCDETPNQSVDIKQEQKKKESLQNATVASDQHFKQLSKTIDYSLPELEELIKDNISYDILMSEHRISRDMLDEIVFIITSTIMTEFRNGYITMGEEKVPHELVKSVFFKLTAEHINMFVDDYSKQTKTISKTTPYIRKSLYNSYGELIHHSRNMAYVDMPQLAHPKKRFNELE